MKFSELPLPTAVATALAKRGYETATPVQAAVLAPEAAGRDLLVSSQTGSGKTIAFGAALAATLLEASPAERGPHRGDPLALVVVPTRELAMQVREELGWLLRETKLRLASFTGGTPVSGDLRTLQRGVDLAIGTPGRLVDLLRRERLSLGAVRVVVLDEADEMLDLGFREDLQTLLQAAPESRRTLLLSATLPPEIQALARRFQRDAFRIAAHPGGTNPKGAAHADITYVAHLVAAADRLAAVVNVLRAAGTARAIVFCTTREGVARLHEALQTRGFAATAISGERAQAERDRALEQLRKGDVNVLVATNVAARGLHLPDVDLIVHADLPLNAESLTHRSGRTGRAGRKGTSVLIATLSERRKAERLLMSAHVPVVWSPPPSATAITAAAHERLIEQLVQAVRGEQRGGGDTADHDTDDDAGRAEHDVSRGDDAQTKAARRLLERLEQQVSLGDVARELMVRELRRLPVGEPVQAIAPPSNDRRDRSGFGPGDRDAPDGPRLGRGDFARGAVLFRINLGARDKADPRWMLPLICRRGGVTRREVGAIRIGPTDTVFEIAGSAVDDFARAAAENDPRAPHVVITRASGAGRPDTGPPPRTDERRGRAPAPASQASPAPAPASAPGFGARRGGGAAPEPERSRSTSSPRRTQHHEKQGKPTFLARGPEKKPRPSPPPQRAQHKPHREIGAPGESGAPRRDPRGAPSGPARAVEPKLARAEKPARGGSPVPFWHAAVGKRPAPKAPKGGHGYAGNAPPKRKVPRD